MRRMFLMISFLSALSGCAGEIATAAPLASQLAQGLDLTLSSASVMNIEQETNRGRGPLSTTVQDGSLHLTRVNDELVLDQMVVNFAPIAFRANGLSVTFTDVDVSLRDAATLSLHDEEQDAARAEGDVALDLHFRVRWQDGYTSEIQTIELPVSLTEIDMTRNGDRISAELRAQTKRSEPVADWLGVVELSNLSLSLRTDGPAVVEAP